MFACVNITQTISKILLSMISYVQRLDPRAELIQSLLDRYNLSYRWLAERIKKNNVSVGEWLQGIARPRKPEVWGEMLVVLRDYERDSRKDPNVKVRRSGLRSVPVYPGLSAGTMMSNVADVEWLDLKDWGTDRERWGRRVEGYSMYPLVEPGDVLIFEDRPFEPGHVVQAFDNGGDCVKVVKGYGSKAVLAPVNPEFPEIPSKDANIKGVVVMRIVKGPNDEVTTTEYPHGMRYRFPEKN